MTFRRGQAYQEAHDVQCCTGKVNRFLPYGCATAHVTVFPLIPATWSND